MTTPKTRIAAIKARCEALPDYRCLSVVPLDGYDETEYRAEFALYASCRQDIPWLVEQLEQRDTEIERLQFENKKFRAAAARFAKHHRVGPGKYVCPPGTMKYIRLFVSILGEKHGIELPASDNP